MNSQAMQGEFEQRVATIRGELRARGLDALLVFSQKRSLVRYISGYDPNYHTNSALVLLPVRQDPVLWAKFAFDLPRAKSASWFQDVRIAPAESNAALIVAGAQAAKDMGLGNARIGVAASDLAVDELSVALDGCLRRELPHAQFEPASDMLNSIRATKSPAEVEKLRESAKLADAVVAGLATAIRPGVSDREAVVAAERVARAQGARCDIIISTDAAKLAYPANGSTFHEKSIATCEITIEFNGYWIQVVRTFSVGNPPDRQKELFTVSQNAYRAGVGAAQPGAKASDVWKAIQQSISRDGFGEWIQYGAGHGIGLDLPEIYPVEHNCHSELLRNMVMVVHPGIWVPQKGAAWTGGPILVDGSSMTALDTPQGEIIQI